MKIDNFNKQSKNGIYFTPIKNVVLIRRDQG